MAKVTLTARPPKAGAWGSCTNPPLVRCAILCLERALESEMDSMNGQHGKLGFSGHPMRFSGRYAVCFAVHFGIQTGSIG